MQPEVSSFQAPALIGMVHLPALPGSPCSRSTLTEIRVRARDDAVALIDAGFDAVMIENFGDAPFRRTTVDAHTVAAMTLAARTVRDAIVQSIGINVLRNDARSALAIASTVGAQFIRVNVHTGAYVTDQGIIEGSADETLRYRQRIGSSVAILADVHVKHATPLHNAPIDEAARETAYRGRADGLIVSGTATGEPASIEDVRRVRKAVSDRPLYVGSGVTRETVKTLLSLADGVIVGTAVKQDGQTTAPVDRDRAKAFIEATGR